MLFNGAVFDVEYQGMQINISEQEIANQRIFRIIFNDKRNPLVVTLVNSGKSNSFWTSIPEGRQAEAEEIGNLINQYFKAS